MKKIVLSTILFGCTLSMFGMDKSLTSSSEVLLERVCHAGICKSARVIKDGAQIVRVEWPVHSDHWYSLSYFTQRYLHPSMMQNSWDWIKENPKLTGAVLCGASLASLAGFGLWKFYPRRKRVDREHQQRMAEVDNKFSDMTAQTVAEITKNGQRSVADAQRLVRESEATRRKVEELERQWDAANQRLKSGDQTAREEMQRIKDEYTQSLRHALNEQGKRTQEAIIAAASEFRAKQDTEADGLRGDLSELRRAIQ